MAVYIYTNCPYIAPGTRMVAPYVTMATRNSDSDWEMTCVKPLVHIGSPLLLIWSEISWAWS